MTERAASFSPPSGSELLRIIHPSRVDLRARGQPDRTWRPHFVRTAHRWGSGRHVPGRPPHDRRPPESRRTTLCPSIRASATAMARLSATSSGPSTSSSVQTSGWYAAAPRDTSRRLMRNMRRSRTCRSQPTRRLSASIRPCSISRWSRAGPTTSDRSHRHLPRVARLPDVLIRALVGVHARSLSPSAQPSRVLRPRWEVR